MKVIVRKKETGAKTEKIAIHTDYIKLQDFLKLANIVETGGMAKILIQDGAVLVNQECCLQRGKKLYPGDLVHFGGSSFLVSTEA